MEKLPYCVIAASAFGIRRMVSASLQRALLPYFWDLTAHRDGSPYPLRKGRMSDPKEVGRTVPVSRRAMWPFLGYWIFRVGYWIFIHVVRAIRMLKKLLVSFIPVSRAAGLAGTSNWNGGNGSFAGRIGVLACSLAATKPPAIDITLRCTGEDAYTPRLTTIHTKQFLLSFIPAPLAAGLPKRSMLFLLLCGVCGSLYGAEPQERPQTNAVAAATWSGVDETVIEKYAEAAGRPARKPLINTDQGDLLLFAFLVAGAIGGFVAGYAYRSLVQRSHTLLVPLLMAGLACIAPSIAQEHHVEPQSPHQHIHEASEAPPLLRGDFEPLLDGHLEWDGRL
jgi:hypothetical protein